MSHYPMIVIGPDPVAALAPFDENTTVEPYRSELEWEEELAKARAYNAEQGHEPTGAPVLTQLNDWTGGGWRRRPGGVGYDHFTQYNPASKWDWYAVGGRWTGMLVLKGTGKGVDECRAGDLDVDATLRNGLPHAVLTGAGEWLERGRMGWFGVVLEEQPEDGWEATLRAALDAVTDPDTRVTLVDCHI